MSWSPSQDRRKNPIELALVDFDVSVLGTPRGIQRLTVDHAPHREALQGNVPTIIHWGPLAAELRHNDYAERSVTIERLRNGTFRMLIA